MVWCSDLWMHQAGGCCDLQLCNSRLGFMVIVDDKSPIPSTDPYIVEEEVLKSKAHTLPTLTVPLSGP